jgi:hypothetical protein
MEDRFNYICKNTNEYINEDTIELPKEYNEVEIELEEVDVDYEEPIDE